MAWSISVAGRNTDVSIVMPPRPGFRSASFSSIWSVISRVLAPGNFSTTRRRPSPSFTTASPMSGWCSSMTFETSERRFLPLVSSIGTLPSVSGVAMLSKTLRIGSRWDGVSRKPPVPGTEASR